MLSPWRDRSVWSELIDGLPGCRVRDLWIGDLVDPSSEGHKVILRAGVQGRGVWEIDVSPDAEDLEIDLYVRRHSLDHGWLKNLRNGIPNPYDPTWRLWHYQCADIKVDAPGLASEGRNFYQTDPEVSGQDFSTSKVPAGPISNVIFDQIEDNSRIVPNDTIVRVHAQVQSRGHTRARNVSVWVLYAPAAAGVPALNSSTDGATFSFWRQFLTNGTIVSGLPANSRWKAVGAPVKLDNIDASHPRVASWNWKSPGEQKHYSMAVFVHSSASPIGESSRVELDEIIVTNKQVGLKNIHIVGPDGEETETSVESAEGTSSSVHTLYAEFHNPTMKEREATLTFDFRQLPTDVEVSLRLTPIQTKQPLGESFTGIARVEESESSGKRLGSISNRFRKRSSSKPTASKRLSNFKETSYVAETAAMVELKGVELPPQAFGAVSIELTLKKPLEPGKKYAFEVQQLTEEGVVGGTTFFLHGPYPGEPVQVERLSAKDFSELKRASREDPNRYVPPWIEGQNE